jgi:hypothetical protein
VSTREIHLAEAGDEIAELPTATATRWAVVFRGVDTHDDPLVVSTESH